MRFARRTLAVAIVAVGSSLLLAGSAGTQSGVCRGALPGYSRLLLVDAGLRAYYRLDEPSGPVACNLAGDADGTYSGNYSLGHAGALADRDTAAIFSGSGTVRVPSAAALNPSRAVTIEAWAQPATTTGSQTLVRKDGQYMLRLDNGSVVFRVWTSAGPVELDSPVVMRTTYYQHLVAAFDGNTMRIYRNGEQIASRSATGELAATGSSLYLGSSDGSYDFYSGRLDEVAVYDRALPASAVQDHFAASRAPGAQAFLGCGFGGFRPGGWPDGCWRPYSEASPFNQSLPASPRIAADSSAVVARLLGFGPINHLEAGVADTSADFGHPTYYSQPSDPLFTLHCYEESWGTCEIEGDRIRIPDAARPAAGDDAHMTVIDQDSGWEYDLYKVRSKPAGGGVLEFRWGGRTRIDGDGLHSGATAAKFGSLAGIVRPEELAAGRIDHALFMTVRCDAGRAVYPASGVGRSCAALGLPTADAPPMGARFQLAMSNAQIDALPVPAWKRTILRAMATYGMFVGDTGGGSWGLKPQSGSTYTSFGYRDLLVEFAQLNGWTLYGDIRVGNLRDAVDWARYLRVIDPCVSRGTC